MPCDRNLVAADSKDEGPRRRSTAVGKDELLVNNTGEARSHQIRQTVGLDMLPRREGLTACINDVEYILAREEQVATSRAGTAPPRRGLGAAERSDNHGGARLAEVNDQKRRVTGLNKQLDNTTIPKINAKTTIPGILGHVRYSHMRSTRHGPIPCNAVNTQSTMVC